MKKLNVLSRSILLALAASSSVASATSVSCSSLPGITNFYVPQPIVSHPVNPNFSYMERYSFSHNDSGEIVALGGNRKLMYWEDYATAGSLEYSNGAEFLENIYALDINEQGTIAARTLNRFVKWASPAKAYDEYSFILDGHNGPIHLNNLDEAAVKTVVNGTTPYQTDVFSYDFQQGSYFQTNISSLTYGQTGYPDGINDNGVILGSASHVASPTFVSVIYSPQASLNMTSGHVGSVAEPFDYYDRFVGINNSNDMVGTTYKTFTNTGLYEWIGVFANSDDPAGTRTEFRANNLVPVGNTLAGINVRGINDSGVAIGEIQTRRLISQGVQEVSHESLLINIGDTAPRALLDEVCFDSTLTSVTQQQLDDLIITSISDNGDIVGHNINRDTTGRVLNYSYYYFTALDSTPPPPPPPQTPAQIEVDNGEDGSGSSFTWVPIWQSGITIFIPYGVAGWESATTLSGYLGDDYEFIAQTAEAGEYSWHADITQTGDYDLSAIIPNDAGNDTAVSYEIIVNGSVSNTVVINQATVETDNAHSLGTISLADGDEVEIKATGSGTGNFIADGVTLDQQVPAT